MDDEKVLITESTLDEIADAIREKNGESFKYYPREMPSAVRRIPTGTGGGSVVAVFPVLLAGTHIADIVVDGETFALYAPEPIEYTQGTGIEISQNGVVSVSEALRQTIAGKVDTSSFNTAIASLSASVASKQDMLTAGQNITIQGNVISATGGGASAVSDLTDVDLNDLADGQILKWNATDEVWENADESGGTTVVANPSGTPTDDLEKIQIGETIYEIPQGGGGGGSQVRELLYEAESSTPPNIITFTKNLTDYDSILFEVIESGRTTWAYSNFFSKEMIENAIVTGNVLTINYTTSNMYIMYVVTDAKTLTLNAYRTAYISKIWGVKGGSGSGGGGSSLPFDVVIDPNDNGINLIYEYDDGQ